VRFNSYLDDAFVYRVVVAGVSREQVAVLPMTLAQALKITEKIPTVFAVDFSCELIGKDEPVFKNITAEKLKALLESANIKM